ncbi:unnamed protein product [[Candida] boidinii]|nr:unnamed protein product [[Candida] boidinii]
MPPNVGMMNQKQPLPNMVRQAPQQQPPQVQQVPPQIRQQKPTPAPVVRPQKPVEAPKPKIPVPLPPHPPVQLSKLTNKYPKCENIIPTTDPNFMVDSFVTIPAPKSKNYEDIDEPNSRVIYPSIHPKPLDIKAARDNLDLIKQLKIHQEFEYLKGIKDKDIDSFIEFESLNLLSYQQAVKGHILGYVYHQNTLLTNTHPNFLARTRKVNMNDATVSDSLYNEQKVLEMHEKLTRIAERQNAIISASNESLNFRSSRKEKFLKLGKQLNNFHAATEKEEQRRIERNAKQRLQALKANDEEAYIKLLDQTKDTRITHLLKQTNSFLASLTQAVKDQQKSTHEKIVEVGHVDRADGVGGVRKTDSQLDESDDSVDYFAVAHRITEKIDKQASILVGGTLKEYQLRGLEWMVSLFNNHLNGILADEMGLGKTIQTISLITYLVEAKKVPGPYLVIVPLSTLPNWNLEFDKWAPALNKISYKGNPTYRKELAQRVKNGDFQVLLTTYEYVIKDKGLLSKIKWVHMIIDEGHRMKNTKSKLSYTLNEFYHTDYRLILTGTPLQNNLPELWALLNFVLPKIFNSVKSFDEWFNTPFANSGSQDKIELSEEETLLVIRRLHKVLRPFLLRRLKKDVEKSLPNKVEKVIKCKKSALQAKLYHQMLKYNQLFIGDKDSTAPVGIKGMNNKLMQLRKICNHPFVFQPVEDMINATPELTNDDIWRVSGKFELLDRVLPKFQATGHRVLMFFQMTQIMDIMEDYLRFKGMQYMRLDGDTKADDRTLLLKDFNAPDSPYFVFLLSTRAGGLGLNLQTADTVIIFDTDWNPHQDLQAQDRAHRIGQKNEVRILRLITSDSIEEYILERAHQKLDIDGKVIQAGKFDQKSTSEEQEALLRQLIENEDTGKEDDENLNDDELNEILARNEDEIGIFKKLDEEREKSSKGKPRLYSEDELPTVYQVEPEPVKEEELILERGTRERKRTQYNENITEEQWLKEIDGYVTSDDDDDDDDDDDPDVKATISRKRSIKNALAAKKIKEEAEKLEKAGSIDDDDGAKAANGSTEGGDVKMEDSSSADVEDVAGNKKRTLSDASSITDAEKGDIKDQLLEEVNGNGKRSKTGSSLRGGRTGARGRGGLASTRGGRLSRGSSRTPSGTSTPTTPVSGSGTPGSFNAGSSSASVPVGNVGASVRRGANRGRGRGNQISQPICRHKDFIVPPISNEQRDIMQKQITDIYDKLISFVKNGRKLCVVFMVKPSRRMYPDYYIIIKNPIAFDGVKRRIHSYVYCSLEEFLHDIHLMFSNARIYNQEGSIIYMDSKDLENVAVEMYKNFTGKDIDFSEFDERFGLNKPLVLPGVPLVEDTSKSFVPSASAASTEAAETTTGSGDAASSNATAEFGGSFSSSPISVTASGIASLPPKPSFGATTANGTVKKN